MKTKKIPMRKCMGCQQMKMKKELIRIVRTPEHEIVLDRTGKQSGRGAYLCPDEACLNAAMRRKSIDRALDMTISEDIYVHLREALTAHE